MITAIALLEAKAGKEYERLVKHLEASDAHTVIMSAYELTVKREFLYLLKAEQIRQMELDEKMLQSLASMDAPLAFLYDRWLHSDLSFLEVLRVTLLDSISAETRNL